MTTANAGHKPPPLINLQRVGAPNWSVFLAAGERISKVLAAQLRQLFGDSDLAGRRILDFGCGCGRVLYPMTDGFPRAEFSGVDVDASAIDYLKSELPRVRLQATAFDPPLPFADGEFDAVYSISIWTHLAPEDQLRWLDEIARIVRPGGFALISTSSFSALKARQKRKDPGWERVGDVDLRRGGVLFIPYPEDPARRDTWRPGIHRPYGLTLNDPAQVKRTFGGSFAVQSVTVDAIDNVQDLVVLRR